MFKAKVPTMLATMQAQANFKAKVPTMLATMQAQANKDVREELRFQKKFDSSWSFSWPKPPAPACSSNRPAAVAAWEFGKFFCILVSKLAQGKQHTLGRVARRGARDILALSFRRSPAGASRRVTKREIYEQRNGSRKLLFSPS